MKSVLLTGLIVNHESPISSSDIDVEYKIIGIKGVDLYTLTETELSLQENATRVISCEYKFETGEYSLVVKYFSGTKNIYSICIKSLSGGILQDIYSTSTVVYNSNLDVMFNGNSEQLRFSFANAISFYFHTNLNKISLKLSTVYDYVCSYTNFSFVNVTRELTDIVKKYLLTKISSGLYRFEDKLIVFKEFDEESLIVPEDIRDIVIDDCKTVKNLVLNREFKTINYSKEVNLSSIAVSRSISYKQFTEIAICVMHNKRVLDSEVDRYYDVGNYKACFNLFQSDKELADSVFGNIDIIVY